jgi:putative MATE family efflux protein
MGAVDTIMVSTVGEFAVSGVNIVDNINNLLIIAFMALSTGGAVVASQYIGRRNVQSSRQAAKQLVYIVTLAALVIMGIALVFRRPIIRLVYGNVAAPVMEAASVYFLITALSYPFLALSNSGAALFRSGGNRRVTMLIALMVNVLNIGGNALCIYGLQMGVAGAALSTLVSRIAAALVSLYLLVRRRCSPVSLSGILKIQLSRPMIRNILSVGIPSGLETSMFQIGRLLTQRIFTSFGTSAFAANAIATTINSFAFMPSVAFGTALLTIVGQCVGAGDYEAAKKQTARVMKITYTAIITFTVVIYIFLEPLIGIFRLSPETHEMAKSFLRIYCVFTAFGLPLSSSLPNALRAAGDIRYVMIVATISMWIVRVSAAYLFTFTLGLGPIGVWLAMGADFVVRGSCYLTRWLRGKWQTKRVIEE